MTDGKYHSNRGARDAGGKRKKKPPTLGKISDARVAWTNVNHLQVVVFDGDTEKFEERNAELDAVGLESVSLALRSSTDYRRNFMFQLTHFTGEELEAFRKIINLACDLAKPRCEAIDEYAKEAFRNGDDTFARLYRALPEVFVRERKSRQHGQGLHDGPEDALEIRGGSGYDSGLRGEVSGVSDELHEGRPGSFDD